MAPGPPCAKATMFIMSSSEIKSRSFTNTSLIAGTIVKPPPKVIELILKSVKNNFNKDIFFISFTKIIITQSKDWYE